MNPSQFRALLRRALLVPLLLFGLLAGALLWQTNALTKSLEQGDQTYKVVNEIGNIEGLLTDSEMGLRGFLLTKDKGFLDSFQQAQEKIEVSFQLLSQYSIADTNRQDAVAQIHLSYFHWRKHAEEQIQRSLSEQVSTRSKDDLSEKLRITDVRVQLTSFQKALEEKEHRHHSAAELQWKLLRISCLVLALSFALLLAIFTRNQIHVLARSFRKAIENLQHTQELYRAVIHNIPGAGVWVVDAEKNDVLLDGNLIETIDLYREENMELARQIALPRFEKALKGLRADYETQFGNRIMWAKYVPLKDSRGDIFSAMLLSIDITEHKKAQSQIRQAKELLEKFVEYAPASIAMLDRQMRFLATSKRWRTDTGTTPDFLQQHNYYEIFPDPQNYWKTMHSRALKGETLHGEAEWSPRDNQRRFIRWEMIPWGSVSDQTGGIILLSEDFTEQRQAQEQLRTSEERWRTTLASIGDAVISTDNMENIDFMNRAAQKLTGWTLQEVKGKSLGELFPALMDSQNKKSNAQISLIKSKRQTTLLQRNGHEILIEENNSPIFNGRGVGIGNVYVFRDVTEERRMEKALQTNDRLITTGKLAASIAHEIHNPLDTVANLLFLLKQETREMTSAEYASLAIKELSRIAQITKQMLTFHREAASPVPVDMADVLYSVAWLYEHKMKTNNIQLKLDLEVNRPFLALPGELRQIFANLIGNAIEALSPKGGVIQIHASESRYWGNSQAGLRITIADNGPGIPPVAREKIFEPFFTTKGEHGTGLGLWISSGLVSKYNGIIKLRSSIRTGHSGTCFSIFLPTELRAEHAA